MSLHELGHELWLPQTLVVPDNFLETGGEEASGVPVMGGSVGEAGKDMEGGWPHHNLCPS